VLLITGAPPADILAEVRTAEMLGGVAPRLRERAVDYVIRRADEWRRKCLGELNAALAAHNGDPCHPDVKSAFTGLERAEGQYALLGGEGEPLNGLGKAMARCPALAPARPGPTTRG
jgi:hypothetical protein